MTRTARRISTLCAKLKDWTDDQTPSIRSVVAAATSARIPAHQRNHIWHFYDEDREAILDGLNLTPKAQPRQAFRPSAQQRVPA